MKTTRLVTHGNSKIGKDTLIINITSSKNCESKKLGMCQVPKNKCYADKAERMYKNTRRFRARQTMLWDILNAEYLAINLHLVAKAKKSIIKYIRFNESGDFRNQYDVEKMKVIARLLPQYKIYGYTARKDLNFENLPNNMIVNGTNFMVDNKITIVTDKKWSKHTCPGDCRYCTMCKNKNGLDIKILIH